MMEDIVHKEEKKKKAHRKRDKFWKFVLPHTVKSSKKTRDSYSRGAATPIKRTSEQQEKINSLSTYAQRNFSVSLDSEVLDCILENNDWDQKKAMSDLLDYEEASHGILVEPPSNAKLKLLGSENDGGTSCYIDALLFAMYISNTSFDPLLTYDIPVEEENKIKLQTIMRLFVNKLRKGHFINADYVHWFRKVLHDAKWNGQDQHGHWTQEDSSELFQFITEMFELPYLPFQIRLFHGANKDSADDRLMTDRILNLSIPADDENDVKSSANKKKDPLQLQDILVNYFYNSIITGVRRQVDNNSDQQQEEEQSSHHSPAFLNTMNNNSIDENVVASPSMATYFAQTPLTEEGQQQVEKDEKGTLKKLLKEAQDTNITENNVQVQEVEEEIAVTAWQVLELLPFYTASNERGQAISLQTDSSFPDTHMILPIVLKRYNFNNFGEGVKIKRRIEIPVTIDFNKFVNLNVDDPMCPTCGHLIDWTLHFKSAVCHLGNSPFSGHYVSYARVVGADNNSSTTEGNEEDQQPYWLKFDDMNRDSRVTVIKENNAEKIYNDLADNAYVVFYELDKTCHHDRRISSEITTSEDSAEEEEEREEDIKQEFKSTGSNSTHETDSEEQVCHRGNEGHEKTVIKKSSKPKLKSSSSTSTSTSTKKAHKHHHHHHHRYHLKESCSLM